MKIYSALQIGEYHLNNCEDYLFIDKIGKHKTICAVMDGCTMGIDSYFISTLVGKLLRKICKIKGYKELYQPDEFLATINECLKSILKELFFELNEVKRQLMLEKNELLTTIIILLYDEQTQKGIILTIGDGLINLNGIIIEYDQDNKPDYIGFHLNEDFEKWYSSQKQKIVFNNLQDISIATDGIGMFQKVTEKNLIEEIDPIYFLTIENSDTDNEEMLNLKLKRLEHVYGLKPSDDLAIIRIIA